MNAVDDFGQGHFLLALLIPAFAFLIVIAPRLSLGSRAAETPYLPQTTLRATLGVQFSLFGGVAMMLWFMLGSGGGGFSATQGLNTPFSWILTGLVAYQALWARLFYVKYDDTTLETIDMFYRKKTFEQKDLISVHPQQQYLFFRLQYNKGHASVFMHIQNRAMFLQDMNAIIAENDARLL